MSWDRVSFQMFSAVSCVLILGITANPCLKMCAYMHMQKIVTEI